MKGEILFQSENNKISADIHDNILYKEENIYLMDNHRLALWCWLQEIDLTKKYNVFHVDAHPDMSKSGIDFIKNNNIEIHKLNLHEYRTHLQTDINVPLFRWDNYISFFQDKYSLNFNSHFSISCTHKLGSSEGFRQDISPIFLLKEIDDIFSEKRFVNDSQWIFNLDLDYFFSSAPHKALMFDKDYILNLMSLIKLGLDKKIIRVCTIALSPECCGSWKHSKEIYDIVNSIFKLDYQLSE